MSCNVPELLPDGGTDAFTALGVFAPVRLIALDLDGTTIGSGGRASYAKLHALRASLASHRYRVDVTIATGRPLTGALDIAARLGLRRNIPLVLYNGSVVLLNGSFTPLLRLTLPLRAIETILELVASWPVRVFCYSYAQPFIAPPEVSRGLESVRGWCFGVPQGPEFNDIPVNWRTSACALPDPQASAVVIDTLGNAEVRHAIEPALSLVPNISQTTSTGEYIEIRPLGSNKARGLDAAATYLGLDCTQVLALGDSTNDIEMLEWAGIGVAVSGASAGAVRSSRFICRHGVVDAAIEILRLVRQARRFASDATLRGGTIG